MKLDKLLKIIVQDIETGRLEKAEVWVALPGIVLSGTLAKSHTFVQALAKSFPQADVEAPAPTKLSEFAHMNDAVGIIQNERVYLGSVRFHPGSVSAWSLGRLPRG